MMIPTLLCTRRLRIEECGGRGKENHSNTSTPAMAFTTGKGDAGIVDKNEMLRLKDPGVMPTNEILKQTLGDSYIAYEIFQEGLPNLDIEQEWQWYTPHKAWFARGKHWWTTPRGTNKEKTLYWLHVFEGFFDVAIWFKEKNRTEAIKANVSEKTRQLILDAKTMGKVLTFPVIFSVATTEPLADIYALIECKKRLER